MDLTNAYLHGQIQDVVLSVIPEGFPGAGEIALLEKGLSGTSTSKTRITKILRSHRHGVQNHWMHTLPQWAMSVSLRSPHGRGLHHPVRWWCLDHGKGSNCQDSSGKDQRTLQVQIQPSARLSWPRYQYIHTWKDHHLDEVFFQETFDDISSQTLAISYRNTRSNRHQNHQRC